MSACERCWSDSHREPYADGVTEYRRLLKERVGPLACTPEQMAGPDAQPCAECGGRLVLHQHTMECMVDASHGEFGTATRNRID